MDLFLELIGGILSAALEIIGQILFEILAEVLWRNLIKPFRRPKRFNPFLAGIGYVIYGAIAGALSLIIIPSLLIQPRWVRVVNLVVVPLVCGLVMATIGGWRKRRDKEIIRLDTFIYAFLFALSMAFLRFIFQR
jgi:hypothetical protein